MYFFDVMSTLIYDPFLRDVPKGMGMSLHDFLSDKDGTAWIDFEKGLIDEEGFAKRFSKDGRQAYAMRDIIWENYRWIDGMKELLQSLRAQGAVICTLSNYPIWYEELDSRMNLSEFVDHHFVSYRIGHRKPSAQTYQIPLQKMQCDPKDAIFIDDREVNCAAARELGMKGIRFYHTQKLKEDLCLI